MITQGKHVEDGTLPVNPGEYSKIDGVWWAHVPAPGFSVGVPSAHDVVENADGTITVSPSILMWRDYGDPPERRSWHGYLEKGIWREA